MGAKAGRIANAAKLATELDGTDWRDILDLALDAMKVRRLEEAERYFDALDVMRPERLTQGVRGKNNYRARGQSWHFDVGYRKRDNLVRWRVPWAWYNYRRPGQTGSLKSHTYTPERRVKQILAAMFHLVHGVSNRERSDLRSYDNHALATAFGVSAPTMRGWIKAGLRDLGVTDSQFVTWSSMPWREWDGLGFLEEDFEPEEVRRKRRRASVLQGGSVRVLVDPIGGNKLTMLGTRR